VLLSGGDLIRRFGDFGAVQVNKFITLVSLSCCISVHAQFTNMSSVLDGSGALASGAGYTNISAAGQPGGIAISASGGYVNFAGFLNTFVIKARLDSDGDGVADENDLDNDNDGLPDTMELGGNAFSPSTTTLVNTRDSDGDGFSDGQESTAGTDPLDSTAFLHFTRIFPSAGSVVGWIARSNKTYKIFYSDNSYTFPTNLLTTTLATGSANAPWYSFTNSIVDATATNSRFYAVEAQP
jgi:hypothetical protein